MGIYGQDWAGYQSPAPSVTGLSFVFLKATEGLTYVNPRYAAQLAYARLHKLTVGHYHYPHMANSPAAEADRFLAVADIASGELPCLDWEGYDTANKKVPVATQVAYKNAFLARVRGKLPTHQVGTYANKAYLDFDPSGPYGDFFWIATAGLPAGKPGISRPWLFHQYGASGVDKDYCPLSAAALWEFAHAKEKDMPLTQADIDKVVAAVWAKPMVSPTNKAQHSAETFLRYGDDHYARLAAAITAQQAPAAPIDYTALAKALLAQIKS
jgi:hypothetical protein